MASENETRIPPEEAFPGERAPVRHDTEVGGHWQCGFEWNHWEFERPSIALVHATGFHARLWDRVVLELGDRHVFAVDMFGHGRSQGGPVEHWQTFVDVLGDTLAQCECHTGLVGVGHSMGGHALVGLAAKRPGMFERLVLIDPVIAERSSYASGGGSLPGRGPSPVARRKRFFDSPEAMWHRFVDRHPYAHFREDVVMDYCRYGLLERSDEARADGQGDWELACPPEVESAVYTTSRTNAAIFDAARALEIPVAILRASPGEEGGPIDFATSPTWPGLVDVFPNARERHLPELTHFMPMQDPAFVARAILDPDAVLDGRVDPVVAPSRAAARG